MLSNIGKGITGILAFILAVLFSSMFLGFPTKWLWNWLMPHLFGFPEINFWKSLGLIALSSFLVRPYK